MSISWELIWQAVSAIASLLTAGGVIFLYRQVCQGEKAELTKLEDMLCQEYRQIIAEIPYQALINQDIPWDDDARNTFYRYFDLTNEQFFMAKCDRVREETWRDWKEGICDNMKLVAFKKAWEEMEPALAGYKQGNDFCVFCGLRWLIRTRFVRDPREFGCKMNEKWPCVESNCGKLPQKTVD